MKRTRVSGERGDPFNPLKEYDSAQSEEQTVAFLAYNFRVRSEALFNESADEPARAEILRQELELAGYRWQPNKQPASTH